MGAPEPVIRGARTAGALFGGVAASARVQSGRAERQAPPKASLDTLETAKNAAYKAVDESGVRFKPQRRSTRSPSDMALTPWTSRASTRACTRRPPPCCEEDRGGPEADRRALADAEPARPAAPADRPRPGLIERCGRAAHGPDHAGEHRQGSSSRPDAEHMTGGRTRRNAAQLITKARDLNTRVAKLRLAGRSGRGGGRSGGGDGRAATASNATAPERHPLPEQDQEPHARRGQPPTRRSAAPRPGTRFRQAGKLSPQGNGLMLAAHLGQGLRPMAPVRRRGGRWVSASKIISKAMTERNVQALRDLIANGGSKAEIAAAQQALVASRAPAPAAAEPDPARVSRSATCSVRGRARDAAASAPITSQNPPVDPDPPAPLGLTDHLELRPRR
jgi:hypothetical protein